MMTETKSSTNKKMLLSTSPAPEDRADDTAGTLASSEQLASEWGEWHWLDFRIIRQNLRNKKKIEECSDCAYLKKHLTSLEQLRQELADRASSSKGATKKGFEGGVEEKERQIEYVRKRLQALDYSAKRGETDQPENQSATLTSVAVEVVEELSTDEQRDRLHLERRVERAAFEGAEALRKLRDRRLFRSTHKTFELYCQDRFGFTRRRINYLISGSLINDNLKMGTNGSQNSKEDDEEIETIQVLPTNERQVRPLAKLDPEQQREAWQQAVEVSGGKVPSGRTVKDIVQRIRERIPVPNPYQIGEVCQFVPKDNPELKGKSKCWAIVREVYDFSCRVQAWDGEYQVRIENLKSLDLSPAQREEVQLLCDRLARLQQIDTLDRGAYCVLEGLGKVTYLTEVEDKILSLLEEYYQVADSSKSKNFPAY